MSSGNGQVLQFSILHQFFWPETAEFASPHEGPRRLPKKETTARATTATAINDSSSSPKGRHEMTTGVPREGCQGRGELLAKPFLSHPPSHPRNCLPSNPTSPSPTSSSPAMPRRRQLLEAPTKLDARILLDLVLPYVRTLFGQPACRHVIRYRGPALQCSRQDVSAHHSTNSSLPDD